MIRPAYVSLLFVPLLIAGPVSAAQPPASATAAGAPAIVQPTYADVADLALGAPVAAHVRLRRALALRPAEAPGVAAGFTRFYLETDIVALIRGGEGFPAQAKYVIDLPNQPNGRPAPPMRRSEWIVFARAVPGRPGELQLVRPDAQLPFTAETAERTRAIIRAALEPSAPPAIRGIGRAFHVPGVLEGASETQFFLLTGENQPISMSVIRAPGEQPRWSVSTSEFVDAGATQPARDTLLWYRLACALPAQLPRASMSETPQYAAAIDADYAVVKTGLGNCLRTRPRR